MTTGWGDVCCRLWLAQASGRSPPDWTEAPFFSLPAGGLCVASEPREDCVHFLVLTDVCGNRTYGVVAQYYRPLHVRGSHSFLLKLGLGYGVILQ